MVFFYGCFQHDLTARTVTPWLCAPIYTEWACVPMPTIWLCANLYKRCGTSTPLVDVVCGQHPYFDYRLDIPNLFATCQECIIVRVSTTGHQLFCSVIKACCFFISVIKSCCVPYSQVGALRPWHRGRADLMPSGVLATILVRPSGLTLYRLPSHIRITPRWISYSK